MHNCHQWWEWKLDLQCKYPVLVCLFFSGAGKENHRPDFSSERMGLHGIWVAQYKIYITNWTGGNMQKLG